MKRIVRLTESDLARIVRRVIKEENEYANKILSQMESLIANGDVESDSMVTVVKKIKDKPTYDAILSKVYSDPGFKSRQGNNFKLISDWLKNKGMDEVMPVNNHDPINSGYNLLKGTNTAEQIGNHLQQFNASEKNSAGIR